MDKTWVIAALGLVLGCGPAVDVEPPMDEDDDAMATGTSTGDVTPGSTGTTPGMTMGPGTTPTTATESGSVGVGVGSVDVGTGDLNIDGMYLLAFSASIDPTHPFQFLAATRAGGGQLDIVLNPLTLDVGSTTTPRLPLGEFLVYEGVPMVGNCFDLDLGEVVLPGSTNPITGTDIRASLVLSGCFEGRDYCGTVGGEVFEPLNLDLAGSTFAATEVEPTALPADFPTGC